MGGEGMDCKHDWRKFGDEDYYRCKNCLISKEDWLQQQLTTAQERITEIETSLQIHKNRKEETYRECEQLQEENVRLKILADLGRKAALVEHEKYNAIFLLGEFERMQEESAILRSALEKCRVFISGMVFNECIYPIDVLKNIEAQAEHALSTPPSGGLSELVDCVSKIINHLDYLSEGNEPDDEFYDDRANLKMAYNKVIGGE
jgi:hypothetical protein